jgi:hypothetical protein
MYLLRLLPVWVGLIMLVTYVFLIFSMKNQEEPLKDFKTSRDPYLG